MQSLIRDTLFNTLSESVQFKRHFPLVARLRNSRHGADRDCGSMNKKQSVRADARVFACFCQATNSTRRVRAYASAEA